MTKTSTKLLLAWLILSSVGLAIPLWAQSPALQLTEKDKLNINAEALKAVKRLNTLLNSLTDEDIDGITADSMILNSYTGPNRYFDNVNSVIEDDINPKHTSADKTDDLHVDTYLNRLFLYYSKRGSQDNQATIIFTEQTPQAAQQTGNTAFIKVFFKSTFKGKYTGKESTIPQPYLPHQRVAEMTVEKGKGKYEWKLFITRLGFEQPGEGMQPIATGRPTIPVGLSINSAEVPFRQSAGQQLVTLKFDAKWIEVTKSDASDVPIGFYQRRVRTDGQVYEYDNTRTIEFKDNSDRFIFQKEITAKWFDRVNPIAKKPVEPDTVASPAVSIAVAKPTSRPDVNQEVVARKPDLPKPKVPTDTTRHIDKTPTATITIKTTKPATLARSDSAQREVAVNKPPAATITVKPPKLVPSAQPDSVQRVTSQVQGLKTSKPLGLPSSIPGLMTVNRKDSVQLAGSEYSIKPKPAIKQEKPLIAKPESKTLGPVLANALDAEARKEKARYRMQGWLQMAAGVAGLAGSYVAYSAIKTDFDAYTAKMDKLNVEYTNWLAVTRQPAGAVVTPLSVTSYGKPATYGVYAGGGISLGLIVNGVRSLMKAGKVKSKIIKK